MDIDKSFTGFTKKNFTATEMNGLRVLKPNFILRRKNGRKPRMRVSPAGLDYQPLLKSDPSLMPAGNRA
jgi:hypothetical protein